MANRFNPFLNLLPPGPPVVPYWRGQVIVGQRDIGFPISPVSRRYAVPQSVPTAMPRVVDQAPVIVASGTYRVVDANGLSASVVDYNERIGSRPISNVPFGALVQVTGEAGSGWLKILSPFNGFVYAPGGAGLARQSDQISPYPLQTNDNLLSLARGRRIANRINRPIGPSIRGIVGQVTTRFVPAINRTFPAIIRRPVTQYATRYRPGNEFANRPLSSLGYEGPGEYLVVARNGLNIRPGPSSNSGASLGVIPFESTIQVVSDAGDGWLQVVNVIGRRVTGYMCISCTEAPGGPWLVLLNRQRDDVLNPSGAVG